MNYARRLLATCLILFALPLFAQTAATGTIAGRVYDDATGRSLQGAVVTVPGTSLVDYTDAEGRFLLSGVRPGPVTLSIEYVGLDPLVRQLTISPGETATANSALKSTVLLLASFEVKEAARGQALAINQQKTAAGIVNIVS